MISRVRRLRAAVIIGALAIATLPAVSAPPQALALSPGVAFSAEGLSTWQTDGVVWALGQSKGRVVAGGTFNELRPPAGGTGTPVAVNGLAILDGESGAPDSCQMQLTSSGTVTPTVRAVTTSPDGNTVYVAGDFGSIAGVSTGRVAAIDVESCTVKPFLVGGISSYVFGLATHGNTLYLAGEFTSVAGSPRLGFAAVNATTGNLLPFRADVDDIARAVAVSPDGTKVAIGGDFFTVNGAASHSIAVVDGATGANLRTYTDNFIDSRSVTKGIFSGPDRFYVSNEGTGGGVFDGRLAISWSTLDQVWRDTCLGATQATLEHQGVLYSASHAHNCSSDYEQDGFQDGRRTYFIAQDAEEAGHLGWNPRGNDGIGEGIGPRALTTVVGRTTGKTYLWSGGEFTLINGSPQQGLTRFGPDDTNPPPLPRPSIEATSEGTIQVRWRASVDPDDSELTYSVYRNGSPTPLWVAGASSVWWRIPQLSFVDTTVVPGVSYTYQVRVSDGTNISGLSPAVTATALAPTSAYAAAVRADAPAMYLSSTRGPIDPRWLQEVGATVSDPARTNLLLSGEPESSSDSPLGAQDPTGSIDFDGSDDFAWSDAYVPGPSTYSIETWVRTTTTRGGLLVGYGNGRERTDTQRIQLSSPAKYDRLLYLENSGNVRFGAGPTREAIRSSQSINDGQWHHVVATQGPDELVLYIDGTRAARTDATANNEPRVYRGGWHLGADNLTGWPSRPSSTYFDGKLDETAIYHSALSRGAVVEHFEAAGGVSSVNDSPTDGYGGAVYDADPELYWRLGETSGSTAADSSYFGTNPGTYTSNVTRGVSGIPGAPSTDPGRAIRVPGSTSGTVATSASGPTAKLFSAELWFKTTTTTGGKLLGFEKSQTGSSVNYDKHIYMLSNGRLSFGTYSGQTQVITSAGSFNDGSWHHVVAGIGDTGQFLYVDGELLATSSVTTSENGDGYWRVGGGNLGGWPARPSTDYFNGTLDEAAIYLRELPRSTIEQHYALGLDDREPPTVPGNLTATEVDEEVFLDWAASSDDVVLAGYEVHRGTEPDFTVDASSLVGESDVASFTDAPPVSGTYYYRVVAIDAAGNASAASETATISVVVVDETAPTTPENLTLAVDGASVSLSWSESVDNVGVAGYRLFRGGSAGFTPGAGNVVVEQGGLTFVDEDVPLGSWFYKVAAFDDAGNVSAASEAIRADVAPVRLVMDPVEDARVLRGAPDNNYGSDVQLVAVGAWVESFLRFEVPPAPAGTSLAGVELGLRTSGDPTAGSVDRYVVDVVSGGWSEGAVTWSNRPTEVGARVAELSGLSEVNTAGEVLGSVAALSGVAGGSVTLRISGPSTSSDNLRLWSREAAAQYRPTLTLVYSPSGDVTGPSVPVVGAQVVDRDVSLSWSKAADDVAVVGYSVYRGTSSGFSVGAGSKIADVSSLSYVDADRPAGTFYYKVVAVDEAGNRGVASSAASASIADVQAPSVPEQVTADPLGADQVQVAWSASSDDVAVEAYRVYRGTSAGFVVSGSSLVGQAAGESFVDTPPVSGTYYYRVVAVDAAGNASEPSQVAVVLVGDNDTVGPTTPGGLAASVEGASVSLSWSESVDNVGVAGYRLFRGGSAGFTPGAGNVVVEQGSRSFVDEGRPLGSWFYKVAAFDEAGNVSAASAAVEAVVVPTTVSLTPTADARVAKPLPERNFGDDVQLAATGGGGGVLESFLRFEVPPAPAGTSLAGVELGLRTSGDPTAGSVDRYVVDVVSGGWSEGAVTWSNRPTEVGARVAELSGLSEVNTAGEVLGSVAALSGVAGGSVTLRISGPSTSSDNLRLWSREAAAQYRPTLTLVYSPSGDVTGPSVPVVGAQVVDRDVSLSWSKAADDVAVVGYSVYRGTSSGFSVGAGSKIADVSSLSYVDADRPAGTFYYKVVAVDEAGNRGVASSAASASIADVQAPSVPEQVTADPLGADQVQVAWSASSDDVAVEAYRVYRGTSAGFVVSGSSLVGQAAGESFVDTPPVSGTYYYRVVAVDAAGNASEPSSVAVVLVGDNDTVGPTTPGGLAASVEGASVSLSWSESVDNVGVAGYRLFRGGSAGFTPGAGNVVVEQGSRSFVDEGRPLGSWFYKVAAFDEAGNVSAASAAVEAVVVPTTVSLTPTADARVAKPLPERNFGDDVQLAATGGGGGVLESFLRFEVPPAPAGTSLAGVELGLRTSGDPTAGSVDRYVVDVVSGGWSEGSVTWSNRPTEVGARVAELSGLSEVNTAGEVLGSVAALSGVAGGSVTLRISGPSTSSDNLRLWSREAAAQYRPTLTLVYSPSGDVTGPSVPVVGAQVVDRDVSLSWSKAADDVAVVGYSVYRGTSSGFSVGAGSKIADVSSLSYVDADRPAGTFYYKVVAVDEAGNRGVASSAASASIADVQAPSVPEQVTADPLGADQVQVAWSASSDDVAVEAYRVYRGTSAGFVVSGSSLVGQAAGESFVDTPPVSGTYYYRVVAVDAAGNASEPSSVAVVLVGDNDTVGPTTPGGLAASVEGASVSLSWSESVDNVGVAGYRLFRGGSAGFTPGAGNVVVEQGSRSFVDEGRPLGSWFYKVAAFDEAGNVSAASAAVEAVVVPTTVSLTPTADARVAKPLPERNFGDDVQLAATGGGSSVLESFLRFELPAAPVGQNLSGVTITLRTSGDPTAGSVDPYTLDVVTGAWSESSVTWNNRPTGAGAQVAELSGLTEVNTPVTAIGDPTALTDESGSAVTLRISGPSSSIDNLRLWSREGPTSHRPVLTLTYS